jgi:hypothetical protein
MNSELIMTTTPTTPPLKILVLAVRKKGTGVMTMRRMRGSH